MRILSYRSLFFLWLLIFYRLVSRADFFGTGSGPSGGDAKLAKQLEELIGKRVAFGEMPPVPRQEFRISHAQYTLLWPAVMPARACKRASVNRTGHASLPRAVHGTHQSSIFVVDFRSTSKPQEGPRELPWGEYDKDGKGNGI